MEATPPKNSNSRFVFFVCGALVFAGVLFLSLFFLTSKAKTPNKYQSLHIPVPAVPKLTLPSPVNQPNFVIPVSESPQPGTPSAQIEETTPTTSESAEISSPSASPR